VKKHTIVACALAALLVWGCAGTQTSQKLAPEAARPITVVPQADWSEAIIYFAITDRWADGDLTNDVNVDRSAKGTFHGGDLAGLGEHLDEIAGLGATAIWITPVVKNIDGFVTGAGFPDWAYHGYWADDFERLDPRFGSEAELKSLVDECHRRGIKVLLDVVYNHAGYGSHYLTDPKTKGWLRSEDAGTCGQDDLTMCVAGLPDFKTELPEVAEFLLQAQLGWAKRSGVDGFRLDTVKHVGHPFWQEHRKRTREQLGPGFFLLGEVWGGDAQVLDPYFTDDELDAGFDFGFQGNVLGFVQGRGRAVAFDHYLKSRERVRPGHLLAQFLSSHDVPGALFQLGGDATLFRLAAVLEFTSVGIPVIYYGEEVARIGGDWPDNRSDMPWGSRKILPGEGKPRDETLRADYTRLIAIRRAHPSLFRGVHEKLVAEGDLLVFLQKDPSSDDDVVVAVNRGDNPVVARFPAPESWRSSQVRDEWNGAVLPLTGGAVETTLEGKTARILVREARH
jgi:glycosidase